MQGAGEKSHTRPSCVCGNWETVWALLAAKKPFASSPGQDSGWSRLRVQAVSLLVPLDVDGTARL